MEPYKEFLDDVRERPAKPHLCVEMALAVEGGREGNTEPLACTARIPAERTLGRDMDLVVVSPRDRTPEGAACKKCEAHVRIQGKRDGEKLARLQEADRIPFSLKFFFEITDRRGPARGGRAPQVGDQEYPLYSAGMHMCSLDRKSTRLNSSHSS